MGELTRSSATKVKHPNMASDFNQKTARILKNELLLHEAVIKNEPETVRKVLSETVDVNARNNYGRAPIHWAASRGTTEIIEMLIAANCDIEARDKFGMRPLLMAAWYGHLEAVKMFIEAGTDVSAVSKKNYTLLMCAARKNRAIIEYLVQNVKSLNGERSDLDGATALHHAAIAGNPDVISALSTIPEIKLDATDKKGQTPLHCACYEGHEEAVNVLINLGANLNSRATFGNTPLHVATWMRHTATAETLLKAGADTQAVNDMGLTALHVAASQGCKGILESILQHSQNIINKQCNAKNTSLHLASQNNEVETVDILIKHGSDLNCLNSKLQTPIHIAAEMGHMDVCKLLLAAGANIEQKEKSGRTPLYFAAKGSFTAIVDMIIKTARMEYPVDPPEKYEINKSTAVKRWNNLMRSSIPEHIRTILWKLAYKQLGPGDWKKLALHWAFTHDQIQAIEHHGDPPCFKDHGHRMLLIWTSSLSIHPNDGQIIKELHDALCAIDKKSIADSIYKQLEQEDEINTKSHKRCHRCTVA